MLQPERPKEVMKNKVRGKVRKNEAEDTTQHRAVRSDSRVRERQGTAKVEKKRGNLRNRRARHSVHDDDTKRGRRTNLPGNSLRWKPAGSGQAGEPPPK